MNTKGVKDDVEFHNLVLNWLEIKKVFICLNSKMVKTHETKVEEEEQEQIPEWRGGPHGDWDTENTEDHSCNPNSTYYIPTCVNPHVICIEQRSFHEAMASTMEAICSLLHQVLQHPTLYINPTN